MGGAILRPRLPSKLVRLRQTSKMTDSSDDMIRTPLSYGSFESQKGYDQKQLVPEEGRRPTLSYFDSNGITEVAEPHLGFIDVSYTIPSGIFSKKKGKIILDSVR